MIGWRKTCHNPTPSGLIFQDIPTRKFRHLFCLSNISLVHFRTRECMNQTPSSGQFQIRPKICFSKTMLDASISKCHHTSYEIWGRLGPRTTASTQVLQRPGVDHGEGHHPRIGSGWRNLELVHKCAWKWGIAQILPKNGDNSLELGTRYSDKDIWECLKTHSTIIL